MTEVRFPISLHAAITPNPNVVKFIADRYIIDSPTVSAEFKNSEEAKGFSPLAEELFKQFSFVRGVFITKNFISVTKEYTEMAWDYLSNEVRQFLWDYITSGKPILVKVPEERKIPEGQKNNYTPSPFDEQIRELMEQHVDNPVQSDGGEIIFRNFKDGVVTVLLKGACIGCPARNKTLKSGIEAILKKHIPEVLEVVAENEDERATNLEDGLIIESPFSLDFSDFDAAPEIGK